MNATPEARKGAIRLALHLQYERRTEAYRGNARIRNLLAEDTSVSVMTPVLDVGLGGRLSATLAVPIVHLTYDILEHQNRFGEALPEHHETQTGLGDTAAMLRWTLTPPGDVAAWVALGVSVPTGAERDYPALRGVDFGEVLTISSGTWDPLLVQGLALRDGELSWSASVSGRVTAYENRFGYRAGSLVQAWLGLERALGDHSLGLRGGFRHQWRAERDGLEVLNSGGRWLLLAPGGDLALGDFRMGLRVELPVWRDLNAGPDDIDQLVNGQTDADARWQLALSYAL